MWVDDQIQVLLVDLLVVEIVGRQDVGVIRGVGGEDLVDQGPVRQIDVGVFVIVEELLVLEFMKAFEHGAVLHVMAVEDGVVVREVGLIDAFHVDAAAVGGFSVHVVMQVVGLVFVLVSADGVIDHGVGDVDPGDQFFIIGLQFLEVDPLVGVVGEDVIGDGGGEAVPVGEVHVEEVVEVDLNRLVQAFFLVLLLPVMVDSITQVAGAAEKDDDGQGQDYLPCGFFHGVLLLKCFMLFSLRCDGFFLLLLL